MRGNRRQFLGWSAAAAAGGLFGARAQGRGQEDGAAPESPPASEGLKLLILGGTGFLGPHTVRRAVERGHTMTLFNRGRTNPHLFPDLEKLRGDRTKDLEVLAGREWDAVIDTSGYFPWDVEASAELLAPNVGQYVFVSSISVFGQRIGGEALDEESDVDRISSDEIQVARETRQITGSNYGALKALCEEAAETAFPLRTSNVRPGLIVGPGDPTDRWTYWPVRINAGGEVLAPGAPEQTVQFIDVRDVADFLIHVIEERAYGVYHADGPTEPLPMGALLETCKTVTESDATITWVDESFLAEQGVRAWMDMPVWIPPPDGRATRWPVGIERSKEAGLRFRPLDDTILATLDWYFSERGTGAQLQTGIPAGREAEVLAAWHEKQGG